MYSSLEDSRTPHTNGTMLEPPQLVPEVVLDIGQRQIIAGFAGDLYPLTVAYRPHLLGKSSNKATWPRLYDLDDAALTDDERAHITANLLPECQQMISRYREEQGVHWLDGDDIERMLDWLTRVFCDEVMITPGECRVVLLDRGFLMPTKTMVVSLLLNSLGVMSVEWLPLLVMTTVALGVTEAVVLNFGWNQAAITVVSDLRDVTPLAINRGEAQLSLNLTRLAIHYQLAVKHPDQSFDAIERMITSGEASFDWDFTSVAQVVTDTVAKLAIDTRPQVLANVMVMGEMVEVPGFVAALFNYLTPQVPGLTARGTLGPWIGASLYVSKVLSRTRRPTPITKDNFTRWSQG